MGQHSEVYGPSLLALREEEVSIFAEKKHFVTLE